MSHLLPAGWSDVARASDIDALRTDTAQHFGNMRAETNAKFDNVDARFDALRIEIDALRADTKEKFDKIDARFEQLEARLEVRFDKIDARFEKIDERFDELASMKRYVITTGIAIIATICAAWSPLWFELL
jgi:predicted nuclease with TOPRIM domain